MEILDEEKSKTFYIFYKIYLFAGEKKGFPSLLRLFSGYHEFKV